MNAGIVLRELWQSWRASLRRPGFVLLTGLALALGVALCAPLLDVLFSMTVSQTQLAVPQPDRLAYIGPSHVPGQYTSISLEQYEQLRTLPGITSIGASTFFSQVNVGAGRLPSLVDAQRVDRGYLATLDMPMALGRYFSAAEDDPHGPRAVIISHGFWLQHFGGSRAVIGKNLSIIGQVTRIVGVLPKSFPNLNFVSVPLLLPLRAAPGLMRDTDLRAIARLGARTSFQQLSAEAALRMRLFFAAQGKHRVEKHPFVAKPLQHSMRPGTGGAGMLLGLMTAALLLLTGSNVVNLMLLRAQQQRHQLAIRAAMGASALRLLLTALADGLLIVLIGCMAGLLASGLLLHALAEHVASIGFSGASHVALTGNMIVFAILIALLITSVGAITGARRARALGASVASAQGLHGGQDARASRLSRVLVVVQAVLATSLVGISMLLAQAAYRGAHANTGYDTHHVYSLHVLPPRQMYPDRQSLAMLAARITAALRSIPGVETAAASDLPLHDDTYDYAFKLPDGHAATVATRAISRDYLQAVRLSLLRGRPFDHDDFHDGAAVALVNAAFAKRYLHDAALGQLLGTTPKKGAPESLRIVGVTANAHAPGQTASPVVFVPLPMDPHSALVYSGGLHFLLRMHAGSTPSLASVRAKVQQAAPALAVAKLLPPSAQVSGMLAFLSMTSNIIATAGLLALLLAGMGLYAVMRVSVNARTREFGVRAALGASPRALFALILRAGLRPLAIGLAVGSVLAVLLGMTAHALLLGLSGLDPSAMLLTWLVLSTTGFLATLGPALRAARTSPTVSLNESAG
ncbi:MAG: ABC transporter permease [Metallibacterium scheffleri]|jgi:predicted permease|uniref:ABC transporter permease n=1 Tax=Metallibacterium scheffleri TaxID=993689 RepID=UPI0026EF8B65|nr:ABC transporter permease [Metallibacterium scheffleri]MCK9365868.1 ABC transporter permease [Metallibacterium scheffleri]